MAGAWWQDREKLLAALRTHGTCGAVSRAHGGHPSDRNLHYWCAKLGIPLTRSSGRSLAEEAPGEPNLEIAQDEFLERLRSLAGKSRTVEQIADELDAAPRRVREGIAELRRRGFRVREPADGGAVVLDRVAPTRDVLHLGLLRGDVVRFGVVSDTHLCSREQAREELELAYEAFAAEGITEVLHAGDLVAGRGIYRTQDQDLTHHTAEAQVSYAVETYPRRDGITTRVIAGNHDIEGSFGQIGFDPVAAVAAQRDDIEYLGPWEAWIDYGPEGNPCFVHLLHGKGGMSYSVSYKAQKLADSYPAGRKPAVLICGHFHVRGDWTHRGVQILFPGCFEWRTALGVRLGLTPAVGFHIVEMTVGPDGSLVGWAPRWHPFYEGRRLAA